VLREKISYLKEQVTSLKETLVSEQNELESTIRTILEKEQKTDENNEKLTALRAEMEQISAKYLSVVDELTESEGELSDNQKKMLSAMGELSDVKSKISSLETSKTNFLGQITSLEERIKTQDKKYIEYKTENVKLENKQQEAKQNLAQVETELSAVSSRHNEVVFTLNQTSEDVAKVTNAISTLENRKKMLEEMQKEFDGFHYSVKKVLQDAEKNASLKQKIVGVVANLITVPADYQTAIEMALGSAVQNVVTEDEDDAKFIVSYLKQNNLGRATFLPISAVKPRTIDAALTRNFKKFNAFGIASDLISYDKKLDNIFKNLLGGTVIVDTLENAVALAKESRYAFRIVTLEGDIINPQGSITGGSKKANVTNLIGRETVIKETVEQLKKLKIKQIELTNKKEKLSNENTTLQEKIKQLSEQKQTLKIELATQNESLENIAELTTDALEQLEHLKAEKASLQQKVEQIEEEVFEIMSLQSNINSSKNVAEGSIQKRQEQFENLKKQRDIFHENMTSVKVQIASLTSEIESLQETIFNLNDTKIVLEQTVEELEEKVVKTNEQIARAESLLEVEESDDAVKEVRQKLVEIREKLTSLDEYKTSLQENQQELEEDRTKLQNLLTTLQNKTYREELNLSKIDTDIENMQERIWEEYELTYSSALEYKAEEYDLKQGLIDYNKTRREIDKLGFVNVNAIEASRELDERYTDLSAQAEDLTKAKDDLIKIIKELSEEMLHRFNTEFYKIQTNFSKVFKELFGGGNAELVLTEPDESGEELTRGIDIIAEPPGKKLQNITLLSGGERALTAIAILFAILKLRPMPFCLLDEIEAALDDANVGRFAKYLHKFSNETQFIVITHRKPTMELADALYGVTMQEKGVSKIVSVKLSEAVQTVAAGGNS
jgi:chromosome segregation protein